MDYATMITNLAAESDTLMTRAILLENERMTDTEEYAEINEAIDLLRRTRMALRRAGKAGGWL